MTKSDVYGVFCLTCVQEWPRPDLEDCPQCGNPLIKMV